MDSKFDIVCLSHLRWGFVFQRPNHLMSRFARDRRVFFVEEPVVDEGPDRIEATEVSPGLTVLVPHLSEATSGGGSYAALVRGYLGEQNVRHPVAWLYTPMAVDLAAALEPVATVYDCMDELSAFHGAPPALVEKEQRLFATADIVFTGGHSLYEAKRLQHKYVHAFPSSVDAAHFAGALGGVDEPDDQAHNLGPRIGYFGVIDERIDLDLIATLADARLDCQIVLLGPVVKIDPSSLPVRPNLHYLGIKPYAMLPSYLAGWDVAIMPFALNAATKFISPTKTLEYLAAGKPVVSTAVRDVVSPYGEGGLVRIGDISSFASEIDEALREDLDAHRARASAFLAGTSWDTTWASMADLLQTRVSANRRRATPMAHESTRAEGGAECSTI